ncbi:MAG: 2-isopropylmalate synthase, partial [Clostridia bacterium]|nr:2-isopropylmalate synthase [Clostridia bacterium]
KAAETAIEAGAQTVNFPDTVGIMTPNEMGELISFLKKNVKNIDKATISVHCHDDLGMAVANTISSVVAGAGQVECTINGIGERAGNAAMEEIVMALKTRYNSLGLFTDIDTTRIYKTSTLVSSIIGVKLPPNKAIVGRNAFLHEAGIHQHGIIEDKSTYEIMSPKDIGVPENELVLGKHSGKHAFAELVEQMGYTLTDAQIEFYFPKFKELADRKKEISRVDIEALLSGATRRIIERKYVLKDYEVTSYKNSASASVTLSADDGNMLTERMTGDGPVDACFKAISAITGRNFRLADYQIHSVSEGKDALGEAIVKLKGEDGISLTGKGLSTDILEASLLAYINATNKLLQ